MICVSADSAYVGTVG